MINPKELHDETTRVYKQGTGAGRAMHPLPPPSCPWGCPKADFSGRNTGINFNFILKYKLFPVKTG